MKPPQMAMTTLCTRSAEVTTLECSPQDLNWTEAESGTGNAGSSEATEAVIFSVSSSW